MTAAERAAAERAAQGLGPRISDDTVLAQIAALLSTTRTGASS